MTMTEKLKIISLENTFTSDQELPMYYKSMNGVELRLDKFELFNGFNGYYYSILDDFVGTCLLDSLSIPHKYKETVWFNKNTDNAKGFQGAKLDHFEFDTEVIPNLISEAKSSFGEAIRYYRNETLKEMGYIGHSSVRLAYVARCDALIQSNDLWKYLNEIVGRDLLHGEFELLNLALGHPHFLILELLMLDNIFDCLVNKNSEGVIPAFYLAVRYWQITDEVLSMLELEYDERQVREISTEIARQRQRESLSRFDAAKSMARDYARDSWAEDPSIRYGVIASDIHDAIAISPNEVNLKAAPTIKTIKSWILFLAPNEDCLKGGRPKTK